MRGAKNGSAVIDLQFAFLDQAVDQIRLTILCRQIMYIPRIQINPLEDDLLVRIIA